MSLMTEVALAAGWPPFDALQLVAKSRNLSKYVATLDKVPVGYLTVTLDENNKPIASEFKAI